MIRLSEREFKAIKKMPELTHECKACGDPYKTVWKRQLYCSPCQILQRGHLGNKSARARKMGQSDALKEIKGTSSEGKATLNKLFDPPEYEWVVAYRIKFSMDASKNRRWSNNGKGATFLNKGVRRYQDYVIAQTIAALKGRDVKTNKLWLRFFVQKPNHRSDAINVVDTLCDAIKVATGLDDNWFCLDRVDWEVKKEDPEIFIQIGQESLDHALVCSHCGEIKNLDQFTNKKNGPHGRDRVCKPCKSVLDRYAREARKVIAA